MLAGGIFVGGIGLFVPQSDSPNWTGSYYNERNTIFVIGGAIATIIGKLIINKNEKKFHETMEKGIMRGWENEYSNIRERREKRIKRSRKERE